MGKAGARKKSSGLAEVVIEQFQQKCEHFCGGKFWQKCKHFCGREFWQNNALGSFRDWGKSGNGLLAKWTRLEQFQQKCEHFCARELRQNKALEQFQQKCEHFCARELRQNKAIEHVNDQEKNGRALSHSQMRKTARKDDVGGLLQFGSWS